MTQKETLIEISISEQEQADLETVLEPLGLTIEKVIGLFFQYVVRTGELPSTLEEVTAY